MPVPDMTVMLKTPGTSPHQAPHQAPQAALRVGFVLLSSRDHPAPSTRVAVLNVLPQLAEAGIESTILHGPEEPENEPVLPEGLLDAALAQRLDVVVFQKLHGESVLALARALRAHGVRTVYLVCDFVDPALAEATDATIVVTDYLRSLYPRALQHKVHVVHDGIEGPQHHKPAYRGDAGSRAQPLDAVLVTSFALHWLPHVGLPPPWLRATVVGRYSASPQRLQRLRQARWDFMALHSWAERLRFALFMAHPRIRCVPWHPLHVYERMREADIGIIPIDAPQDSPPTAGWRVKSENRLTLKMAMGLPVVATPIPAYEAVIEQGVNGFLARSPADWQRCLGALRDPALRREMGLRARASVLERFSMEHQALRLAQVLKSLGPHTGSRPAVAVQPGER